MNVQSEKLTADFKVLMTDIESLVKSTADQTGEKVAQVRSRVQQAATDLKPRLAAAEILLKDKTKAAAATTNSYVHDNPWTAAGVAGGIGLIIGLLIGRR